MTSSSSPSSKNATTEKRTRKFKSTLRTQKKNGRLGVDELTPLAILPPLQSPVIPYVPRVQQQQEERQQLIDAFTQRLKTNTTLYNFQMLRDVVQQELVAEEMHIDDCFDAARATAERVLSTKFPFVAQFLVLLVQKMQELVQEKLHQEAERAMAPVPLPLQLKQQEHSNNSPSENHEASDDSSSSESDDEDDHSPPPSPTHPKEDNEQLTEQAKRAMAWMESLRAKQFPKSNTFRRSLKCRKFPPTRVPPSESVTNMSSYTPFDYACDLRSIQLSSKAGREDQWTVTLFPKAKPSLSRVETAAFMQWATSKLSHLTPDEADASFDHQQDQFRTHVGLYEHICYEMARLVFDQCPTTARFLHGLFAQLVEIATQTLVNAQRESQIIDQRHKNVQLELSRLETKLNKLKASLIALEETLGRRQRNLLRERELIIRQRKKINLLLCADQVIIRAVMALIQTVQEMADTDSPPPAEEEKPFTLVEQLYQLVVDKFSSLAAVRETHNKWERLRQADHETQRKEVIVLSPSEIATCVEAFGSTLRRLQRLVANRSPDSSLGWDSVELWDQALFIPPHEEIQDLERDVQRLCRQVEQMLLQDSLRPLHSTRHVAVQTDLSGCNRPSPSPRHRLKAAMALNIKALTPADDPAPVEHVAPAFGMELTRTASPLMLRQDQEELLSRLPSEFKAYMETIPSDYKPHQLPLTTVHAMISYLFNQMWLLLQEEHMMQQQLKRFSATTTTQTQLPVASVHEYVVRIYMQHFRVPAFAISRLLDLIVSMSRLDTQSCKVELFCRLLGLAGVEKLGHDGFWFVLKTLHVLQRACVTTGHYFLLDAEGEMEFCPNASALEALNVLFAGCSNELMKRLRLKLSGLASVYGSIWIPVYKIVAFVLEEWQQQQQTLRRTIEEKIYLMDHQGPSHHQIPTKRLGRRPQPTQAPHDDRAMVSFEDFARVFASLHLKVNRFELVQLYRRLLQQSKAKDDSPDAIDLVVFRQLWVQTLQRAINQAHQQQMPPTATAASATAAAPAPSNPNAPVSGLQLHLGAPSDAMLAANEVLAMRFLNATWEQVKTELIRRLDQSFHDVGLQVRLIQQMDAIIHDREASLKIGWRSLQQLIQLTYTSE